MAKFHNSSEYLQKKAFFDQLLTVYGRKPVLEILEDERIQCYRLHLAESNKASGIIEQITREAKKRDLEIQYHDRQALSRISKNNKQDQGVCLDIQCPNHKNADQFLSTKDTYPYLRLLALDGITNPQNFGMIIRAACAGDIQGILFSEKGNARLDSLVIKASAGTLFKAPLLRCSDLQKTLTNFQNSGAELIGLNANAKHSLKSFKEPNFVIYVLGNETKGISNNILSLCDRSVFIPMNNQVESLNVAVTASLLAFRGKI